MPEDEEIDLTPDEEKGWLGKIKDGIYENWQTILVALVVLIVGISAYNYNEKTGNSNSNQATEQTSESSQQTEEAPANTDQEQNAEKKDEAAAQQQDQQAATKDQQMAENKDAAKQANPTETNKEENKAAPEQAKTETKNTNPTAANSVTIEGDNYKTVAAKGDGLTHLARKALNKYLEENKDDQITDLHRIYIEDYLRKQLVNGKGGIKVGHEETFSKSAIEKAIASSKNLSQKSLDNLKKYSTVQ